MLFDHVGLCTCLMSFDGLSALFNTSRKWKCHGELFSQEFTSMGFRVALSTAPDPQGSSWVDIMPTRPYSTTAWAAAVFIVAVAADRDSSRCHYSAMVAGRYAS